MKRLNKLISSVVVIAFILNTCLQDYALALAPEAGFARPGLKEAILAGGQKLLANKENSPSADITAKLGAYKPEDFAGDVPDVRGLKFVKPNFANGTPQGWENNALLKGDVSNLVEAFKYFRDSEARLGEPQLEIVEGDFKLEKGKDGEIPICRIEQDRGALGYRLVLHKDFVRRWADIKKNDVWFEYTFPDGKVRTVSLAWAIFYRIAKHEMSDIKSLKVNGKFIPKSHGHMEYDMPLPNEDEIVANSIRGRYAVVNDAVWMWFLGSYSFGPFTQYSDSTFEDRARWFLGLYKGQDPIKAEKWNRWAVEHNLPDEFPNLHNSENRETAISIARAVNKNFYMNYKKYEIPISAEKEAEMARNLAEREKSLLEGMMYATGDVGRGRDVPLEGALKDAALESYAALAGKSKDFVLQARDSYEIMVFKIREGIVHYGIIRNLESGSLDIGIIVDDNGDRSLHKTSGIEDPITPEVPSTILKTHPDYTMVLDELAAKPIVVAARPEIAAMDLAMPELQDAAKAALDAFKEHEPEVSVGRAEGFDSDNSQVVITVMDKTDKTEGFRLTISKDASGIMLRTYRLAWLHDKGEKKLDWAVYTFSHVSDAAAAAKEVSGMSRGIKQAIISKGRPAEAVSTRSDDGCFEKHPGKSPEDMLIIIGKYIERGGVITAPILYDLYKANYEELKREFDFEELAKRDSALRTIERDLFDPDNSILSRGFIRELPEKGANGERQFVEIMPDERAAKAKTEEKGDTRMRPGQVGEKRMSDLLKNIRDYIAQSESMRVYASERSEEVRSSIVETLKQVLNMSGIDSSVLELPLTVGAFTETKQGELRAGLTPDIVSMLTKIGIKVIIQRGMGVGAGFSDAEYVNALARLVDTREEVIDQADIIQHIKELQSDEIAMVEAANKRARIENRSDKIIWNFNHFANCLKDMAEKGQAVPERLLANAATGASFVSFENVWTAEEGYRILKGASQKAGVVGAYEMARYMLELDKKTSIVGAMPVKEMLLSYNRNNKPEPTDAVKNILNLKGKKVSIYGGGTVGYNEARILALLGADVAVLEQSPARRKYLEGAFAKENLKVLVVSSEDPAAVENTLKEYCDGTSTTAYTHGAKAQKLISKEMVERLGPGRVYVVVDIDQGGGIEGVRETSHAKPVYMENGCIFYCVPNIPARVPRQTSTDISLAAAKYLTAMALYGLARAAKILPELGTAVDITDGHIVSPIIRGQFPKAIPQATVHPKYDYLIANGIPERLVAGMRAEIDEARLLDLKVKICPWNDNLVLVIVNYNDSGSGSHRVASYEAVSRLFDVSAGEDKNAVLYSEGHHMARYPAHLDFDDAKKELVYRTFDDKGEHVDRAIMPLSEKTAGMETSSSRTAESPSEDLRGIDYLRSVALDGEMPKLRIMAAAAVIDYGPAADRDAMAQIIAGLVNSTDMEIAIDARTALLDRKIDEKAQIKTLGDIIGTVHPPQRVAGLASILKYAKRNDDEVTLKAIREKLDKFLTNEIVSESLKVKALKALCDESSRSSEAAEALTKIAADDKSSIVRAEARIALLELGIDKDTQIAELKKLLPEHSTDHGTFAAIEKAVLLNSPSAEDRKSAGEALYAIAESGTPIYRIRASAALAESALLSSRETKTVPEIKKPALIPAATAEDALLKVMNELSRLERLVRERRGDVDRAQRNLNEVSTPKTGRSLKTTYDRGRVNSAEQALIAAKRMFDRAQRDRDAVGEELRRLRAKEVEAVVKTENDPLSPAKSIPAVIDDYALNVAKNAGPGSLDPANLVNEIASFYPAINMLEGERVEVYLTKATNDSLTKSITEEIRRINAVIRERIRKHTGTTDNIDDPVKIIPYNSANLEKCLARKGDGVRRIFISDLSMTADFKRLTDPANDTGAELLRDNRVITMAVPKGRDDTESTVNQACILKIALLSALLDDSNTLTIGAMLKDELNGRISSETPSKFIANLAKRDEGVSRDAVRDRVNYFLLPGSIVKLSTFIGEQLRILKAFWIAA